MDKYIQSLKTKYKKLLSAGKDKDSMRNAFIREIMDFELSQLSSDDFNVAKPSEIYDYLLDDDTVDDNALRLDKSFNTHQILRFRLSPAYELKFETSVFALRIYFNGAEFNMFETRYLEAVDIAEWASRQNQRLEEYLTMWDGILNEIAKKSTMQRLALQAVKGLTTNALRDYPDVRFEVIEQARRVKVKVLFPQSNLGVNIHAYYGSYKKTLPTQLEDLKRLIEVQAQSSLKTFFTYVR